MNQCDFLFITAHPDDAFIGAGGLMFKMKHLGKNIRVVSATDGDFNNSSSSVRSTEFNNAIDYAGVNGISLKFSDGFLQFQQEKLCRSIYNLLIKYNPTIIVTHCREDSHSDHRAISYAVDSAIELLYHSIKEKCNLQCVLSFPSIRLTIESLKEFDIQLICDISNFMDNKIKSVNIHSSQMPFLGQNLKKHIALNNYLGALLSCDYAEGYQVHGANNLRINRSLVKDL